MARRTGWQAGALLLCALPWLAPALADVVVVRATGPSAAAHPAGQRLPETSRIALRTGDRVVLIGPGGSRTIAGPGDFSAGPSTVTTVRRDQTALRYAAALARANTRSAIGANRRIIIPATVRAEMNAMPVAPGLWSYIVGTSGTVCVPLLDDVLLERGNPATARTVTIAALPSTSGNLSALGARQRVSFAAGVDSAPWPAMPVAENTTYLVIGGNGLIPARVRFTAIGTPPTDAGELAALLAARGCTEQLQRLTSLMPDDPTP